MRKKIAIIGDSLIQCLWANYLAQFFSVVIYTKSQRDGGAWFSNEHNDKQATNNIIYPGSDDESSFVSEIFSLFLPLSSQLKLVEQPIKVDSKYIPNIYIVGNFVSIMKSLKENQNISCKLQNIKSIKLRCGQALLDNQEYDHILFNENFYIENITIGNKFYLLDYEKFLSRHLTIKLCRPIDSVDYTSAFDNVFDRGGFLIEDRSIFVGRVRREFKALSEKELIEMSSYFFPKEAYIEKISSNYFNHERPKSFDLQRVLSVNSSVRASQNVTSSFIPGYIYFKKNRGLVVQKIERHKNQQK